MAKEITVQCACGKKLEVDALTHADLVETVKQHGWTMLAGTSDLALCRACGTAEQIIKETKQEFCHRGTEAQR